MHICVCNADRKWYRQNEKEKAPQREAARLRAQDRERKRAKKEIKNRLIKRKMGGCRYHFCCCQWQTYYRIAIADRDGRPDFENPMLKAMVTRNTRFKSVEAKETASEIFERHMTSAYKKMVEKAQRDKEKMVRKHESAKKERQSRRSKRNRNRRTTSARRGYPAPYAKKDPTGKFKAEYKMLKKSMSARRVAPEEAW